MIFNAMELNTIHIPDTTFALMNKVSENLAKYVSRQRCLTAVGIPNET